MLSGLRRHQCLLSSAFFTHQGMWGSDISLVDMIDE